jgi:predicted adenine nucleotide alpha hydrolase (AANH) superfamily ATPase
MTHGFESEPEGGKRCDVCYLIRLEETARRAHHSSILYFGTTLTISPHKDSQKINIMGTSLSEKYSVRYLAYDFKEENGFLKSVKQSKQLGLYRQRYCGCYYSKL